MPIRRPAAAEVRICLVPQYADCLQLEPWCANSAHCDRIVAACMARHDNHLLHLHHVKQFDHDVAAKQFLLQLHLPDKSLGLCGMV